MSMDHLMENIVPGPRKAISYMKNHLNQVNFMELALVGMIMVIKKRRLIIVLVQCTGWLQLGHKMVI